MNAAEVIEQIEKLEPEQKREVISHVMVEVFATLQSSEVQKLLLARVSRQPLRHAKADDVELDGNAAVSSEFKAVAAKVFSENEELFRKLAQ